MNKVSREDFNKVMDMYPELNSATTYECGAGGTPPTYESLDEYVDTVYSKNSEHFVTGHDIITLIINKLGGDNLSTTKQTSKRIGRDEFNRVLQQYIPITHGFRPDYLRVSRGILIMAFVLAGYTQDPCSEYIKINISKKLYQQFVEDVDMWDHGYGCECQYYHGVLTDSTGKTYKNLREAAEKSKIPLHEMSNGLRGVKFFYCGFRYIYPYKISE